jgi:peptidoglycan/xylan/chitin deacetylase (PgdA/CDA1 family)
LAENLATELLGEGLANSRWHRILMYHSIGRLPEDPIKHFTSPERFHEHMNYLKRRGLRGVSIRELHQAVVAGDVKGLVGITFDDGYKDFLQVAVPALEDLGFSATVFAVGGMLGRENDWEHDYTPRPRLKLLEAEDLREVSRRGMEVGAHGMSHVKLASLGPEQLEEEVKGSRRLLSEMLGEEVEGFSYPYGSFDSAALEAVRRAGYTYACAAPSQVDWNQYALPRIPVADNDHLLRFAAKVSVYRQYSTAKKSIRMAVSKLSPVSRVLVGT